MSYSNSVKVHEIEPVYYASNQRAEFRLPPDKIYSSNLILCNLGATKSANQSPYHQVPGVYGICRSISIFDGNVELTSLQNAHLWAGFKQLSHSNQYNESVGPYYCGNLCSNGFETRDLSEKANGTGAATNVFGARIVRGTIRTMNTAVTSEDSFKGSMKMAEIVDLLANMPYIDTSVFKKFRIVIEFHSASDLKTFAQAQQKTAADTITTTRPFLVAEEMTGAAVDAMMGKMQPIEYTVIEQDLASLDAVVPTTGAGATDSTRTPLQPKTFHVSGYNNKTVEKILIWKQPTLITNYQVDGGVDGRDVGWGIYSSTGFLGEKCQIRVNGRNIWARSGIDKPNSRLAYMVDSWGDGVMATHQNGLAFQAADNQPRSDYWKVDGNQDIGSQDFIGVNLGLEKVQDLQIDFERRGFFAEDAGQTALSKYNSAYNLRIFAEVRKQIIPQANGGYNVIYV
tara:strand:- start:71 stop:1435 length:1365 start_codon:yes stop_codon:yes gene_type:complete